MNSRKKFLWLSLCTLGLIGVAGLAIPFFGSMNPSAAGGAELPHIDVSKMSEGQYIRFDKQQAGSFGEVYFIVKESPEIYRVFFLATRKGNYILPDKYGSYSGLPCAEFRPDAHGPDLIEGGHFRCHDEPGNGGGMLWGFDGRHKNDKWSADLPELSWHLSGKHLVIRRG